MKTGILVTGDFIRDYNIIKQPVNPTGYRDSLSSTILKDQAGGAWYLAELIKLMSDDSLADVCIPDYDNEKESGRLRINQAFQIWNKFGEGRDEKKKSVWRIENFLGCERSGEPETDGIGTDFNLLFGEIDNKWGPEIIVIDDIGLGFADDKAYVDELFRRTAKVKNIILKTHSSKFKSLLWTGLSANKLLEKTTVVITADSLREGGAYLSRGFSWDKTIEEVAEEFDSGYFSYVLGGCKRVVVLFDKFGVASFTREPLHSKFKGSDIPVTGLTFERFVYDKENYEGAWDNRYKGSVYGSLSILVSAVAVYYSGKKVAVSYIYDRALNTIQYNFETGGGSETAPGSIEINDFTVTAFLPGKGSNPSGSGDANVKKAGQGASLRKFYSAYPKYCSNSDYGLKKDGSHFYSGILNDVAGLGDHFLLSKAIDIIMRGPDKALEQVPVARFGKYLTFDREEIERINSVQNMIRVYLSHPSDNRPLSFAVFGAPGSGKSFAIKQLLESIFGKGNEPIVFNLSQFRDVPDLHQALHIVRDRTIKGAMPLIFWDEFDSLSGKWLKEFLAPMQDGDFSEGGISHPLGRAIFVFAGGTCDTFEEYEEKFLPEKEKKGPDFISRLRGFVNIKGPNKLKDPVERDKTESRNMPVKASRKDDGYIIRRAIMIYSNLKKHHSVIFEKNNIPSISPGVVNALLKTEEYLHGARSMESIISLSRTGSNKHFDTASLPSPELLKIHTSNDFQELVHKGELEYSLVENLAEAIHNQWKTEKENKEKKNGKPSYVYGKSRNDGPQEFTHPRLLDYQKLKEEWKEENRITARLTWAKFATVGFQIIAPGFHTEKDEDIEKVVSRHLKALADMEHDIWLRTNLINGFEYDSRSDDSVLLHKDIAISAELTGPERELDNSIIEATVNVLKRYNYKLREAERNKSKSNQ